MKYNMCIGQYTSNHFDIVTSKINIVLFLRMVYNFKYQGKGYLFDYKSTKQLNNAKNIKLAYQHLTGY